MQAATTFEHSNTRHQTIIDLLDQLPPLLGSAESSLAILAQLRAQVLENRPALLLFGNYNAGKSTLINLLLDMDTAPVGDIPLTSSVNAYEWRGIRLLDSPGINAPITHQEITQSELDKVDLILFVIRSGDVDEAAQFEEMARLLAANKQICIVLNCDSSDPQTVQAWHASLNANLLHYLPAASISEQVIDTIPVLPANLLTATKARQTNQATLMAMSGFTLVESRLSWWANEQWQAARWLPGLFSRLDQQLLQPRLQDTVADPEGQAIDQQLETLAATEYQWKNHIMVKLTSTLQALRPRLSQILGLPAEEINEALTREVSAQLSQLQTWLAHQYAALSSATLQAGCTMQAQDPAAPAPQHPVDEIIDLGRTLTPERLQSWLEDAKALGLPVLNTMSNERLHKIGKRIGLGLQLITAGWDYYAAGRDEKEAGQLARQQALRLHQQAEATVNHLQSQLQMQLSELVSQHFSPQRELLLQERGHVLAQRSHQQQLLQQLRYLRQQLDQVCHVAPAPAV